MMTLFHLWDLPGDVLAAPESASGLDRCNLSLSLSLSGLMPGMYIYLYIPSHGHLVLVEHAHGFATSPNISAI